MRVISGGQTGVDQAALRAARACGLETGGFAPSNWRTETGPAPWLADYGLLEHTSRDYRDRTWDNVKLADATLWVGKVGTPGYNFTHLAACFFPRPWFEVKVGAPLADARAWLAAHRVCTLNVAGNREAVYPGIGAAAETWLTALFLVEKP